MVLMLSQQDFRSLIENIQGKVLYGTTRIRTEIFWKLLNMFATSLGVLWECAKMK